VEDKHLHRIEPLRSPWREQLIEALAHVQHHLLLIGPYIKADIVAMLREVLAERPTPQPLVVRVITRILPDDFLSGASDIAALQHLLAWPAELPGSSVELRAISNLHAKVWVFDSTLALVGSGNATFSGLESNLEYGLAIADPSLVERILQDWQAWWEQAASISAGELEQMSLWLDALADDSDVLRANRVAMEKRQAAERRIGTAPRIGNRVVVARAARTKSPVSEPSRPYTSTAHANSSQPAPETQQVASHELPAALSISAARLWQALRWTTPWLNGMPHSTGASGAFLKLATRLSAHGQGTLQCTWADGKRYSQASIPVNPREALPSWTVTLGIGAVQQLAAFLQQVHDQSSIADRSLSEDEVSMWWQPSPPRLCISPTPQGIFPLALPCMQAAMPGNVAAPHPPVSQIVVKQAALLAGVASLKQQWEISYPSASALETIELSFDSPGVISTLQLSVGPIDAPLLVLLEARDCILDGPEIRLRLDFSSFQHVVMNTPEEVRHWRLRVGRDANAVQFVPEFESEIAQVESGDWMHELRNVAEG
jgi:hypothetical protein